MIAADERFEDAGVAVLVRSDLKGRGGNARPCLRLCEGARGFKRVHSMELADSRSAIALEEEMGFTARPALRI